MCTEQILQTHYVPRVPDTPTELDEPSFCKHDCHTAGGASGAALYDAASGSNLLALHHRRTPSWKRAIMMAPIYAWLTASDAGAPAVDVDP